MVAGKRSEAEVHAEVHAGAAEVVDVAVEDVVGDKSRILCILEWGELASVTEVLFYHLQSRQLENVLPTLLEKTLSRDWRAIVRAQTEEFLDLMDALLWSYTDESFLPHGTAKDGQSSLQPIFLTTADINPNGASVKFLIEGAEETELGAYERIVYLFDGRSDDALNSARAFWRRAKEAGCEVTYWQENDRGGWKRQG